MVTPKAKVERSKGGTFAHKNPNCPCPPCSARRRAAQALTVNTWASGKEPTADDAVNADMPITVLETDTPKARVAQWLQMRALDPDLTITEAARQMRINRRTLNAAIQIAVSEGWLKFEDPMSRVDYEIIPKALRNLNKFLDEGDKTVTIEVAKGTIFKQFQEAKGISDAPQTVLALKIEQPLEGGGTKTITGHVVGKPRSIAEG